MGKMKNGINGEFSGKVGNVIGSNWRGINYIRSAPAKKQVPFSPAQLRQQARFSMMMKFLFNFKSLLNISFSQHSKCMTGLNEALSYNLGLGISGEYPHFTLNYPEIRLSCGKLRSAGNALATAGEAGTVNFSWVNDTEFPANGSDLAIMVIYNPATQQGIHTFQGALRESGAAAIKITANRGCAVQTWLAFMSSDTKLVSNSIYTGTVITT